MSGKFVLAIYLCIQCKSFIVIPKISRNKNLSRWAYLVHVYFYPGFKNHFIKKIVSFFENLDIQRLEQRFGEIPEICDFRSKACSSLKI